MSCPDYVGWGAVRRLSAKEPVIGNRHLRDLVTRRCDRDATPQKAANAASTILPPLRSEPRLLEGAQPEYERTGHGSSGVSLAILDFGSATNCRTCRRRTPGSDRSEYAHPVGGEASVVRPFAREEQVRPSRRSRSRFSGGLTWSHFILTIAAASGSNFNAQILP
jgi:hypothetical protein